MRRGRLAVVAAATAASALRGGARSGGAAVASAGAAPRWLSSAADAPSAPSAPPAAAAAGKSAAAPATPASGGAAPAKGKAAGGALPPNTLAPPKMEREAAPIKPSPSAMPYFAPRVMGNYFPGAGESVAHAPGVALGAAWKPAFFEGSLKEPTKRAGGIINALNDMMTRGTKQRAWALTVKAGDSVEVLYKDSVTQERPRIATGVVVGITKPRSMSAMLRIYGVVGQSRVEYMFPVYSPTLVDVKLLQRAFIKKGKKRVKRAKLYYLKDRPLATMRVAPSRETVEERERYAEERRKAREAQGGGGKKAAPGAGKKKA